MDNQVIITIIILLLVSLLFVVAYINSKRIPEKRKDRIFKKLDDLKDQIKDGDTFAMRDAVIRLDNLLSKALQIKYRNENSCGDNLKLARKLFNKTNYQQLWDVHKLRNDIVHSDKSVTEQDASEAYDIYKMGINKILR
ncbi:MAG: hypothetical protein UR34_C0005G0016 [candidate division WS6 bacterium GW2011_GWC1_33_20]|uniref:DUF4145 domain-containing protein n=2 Tax=Candidatus Dojkabacteria TaxID=74243 RepID=A0A0G0DIC9_9BACT|nr:MAG: hypothetical protein UR32_C0002G0012 [candidate division WS6 bacterium GW2011_GWE2_33_157]KKP44193.1 MAG: hypothetical protein UR34_C0005G0016 [candidate division WS6 bacterium GW2011_GWC1_33_20]KKP45751.1 MAG: hypothetical protein UR36_C0004G0012 [candidate division WS6 bacterium GW2011_GWF1_33_233]KKP55087.1 MAG: hypothetical protein UR47_C0005G0016 [candidate division WS6 bacterium GW2011_GWB1_33_6]KKP55194.1 MAG: hypothetical protein UR45_C0003G0012 [candidate division WS6 bacterium